MRNLKNEKIITLVLIVFCLSSIAVSSQSNMLTEINQLPENVKKIEKSEVPEGIEPLKFDSMKDYLKYLEKGEKVKKEKSQKALDNNQETSGEISTNAVFPAITTTHSEKVYNALVDVYAYVNYTFRYDDYMNDCRIDRINFKYTALSGMAPTHVEFIESLFTTTIKNNREIEVIVAGTYKTYADVEGFILATYDDVQHTYTIDPQ